MTTYRSNLIAVGKLTPTPGNPTYAVTQWDGKEWSLVGDGLVINPPADGPLSATVFDGKLIVAGSETNFPTGLAQWDGNAWSMLSSGVSADIGSLIVRTLLVDSTGKTESLIVSGWFTAGGEVGANNLVRLSSDNAWSRLSECPTCLGLSGPVAAITSYDDGTGTALYVAGYARFAGTKRINRIAKWDGTSWGGLDGGLDRECFALEVFDDGSGAGAQLYVGGVFAHAGNVPAKRIAKWNGQSWSPVGAGIDSGGVLALQSFDDGTGPQLYVGGTFSVVAGKPAFRLARWDGMQWAPVGGLSSGGSTVLDLDVWNDGVADSLVVAGDFSLAGPPQALHIASWRNGQWSTIGGSVTNAQPDDAVQGVAVSPKDGSLYAFGKFSRLGITPVENLARWDGSEWHPIPPPAQTHMSGSKVIVHHVGDCELLFTYNTGTFGSSNPFPLGLVWQWNGRRWQTVGGGMVNIGSAQVWAFGFGYGHAIAAFHLDGDRLCVGGTFAKAGDTPSYNFAIWDIHAAISCGGDIDYNNVVDVADLLAVMSAWGACANCATDPSPCGGDGVVNVTDLLTVIAQWGPCP